MLGKVGIQVEVEVVDHSVHLQTSDVGKYDEIAHQGLKHSDPEDYLEAFLVGHSRNGSHVDDPWLTEKILEQRKAPDFSKRKALIVEIAKYLAGQAYVFRYPLKYEDEAWQPWLKGYKKHVGYSTGRFVERAWIDRG